MIGKWQRLLWSGATAALLVTMVVACGSSTKSTNSAPPTTGATGSTSGAAQTTSGTPISVGFECSCSGVFASSTAIQGPVITAWADYENAHGGIDGHGVDMIKMDDA